MFKNKITIPMLGLTLIATLASCSSHKPKIQEFADSANAQEEVERLASDIKTAKQEQLNVLSPSAYERADEELTSAVEMRAKGKDTKDILHEVAVGRAYLERAQQFGGVSRTNLEEVVAARQAAMKAEAPKLFADDFKKADKHLTSVTSEIEDNDMDDVADERTKLQVEYMNLEVKAIKEANLGQARNTIDTAVKEGAKNYARQSLATAEQKLAGADAYIVAHRHDAEVIKTRSEDATAAANHLLKITRAAKAGKDITPEEIALQLEREKGRTQAARSMAAEAGSLKEDAAFNERFEAARAEFSAEEAEVYRQGDQLVIRLRALEFPVNQSVLRGANFPLLAKVAKAVKGFGNPVVVIEGHTDASGSAAVNHKLSQERAQAVSQYLVSNNAVEAGMVTVVGHGFDRPLASNKTAKGRAQNRRVDIIISAEKVAE